MQIKVTNERITLNSDVGLTRVKSIEIGPESTSNLIITLFSSLSGPNEVN